MDLDPLVIPIVNYFNSCGLPTVMSCQGHNKTNMSMFWVQFADSVTDEDIEAFMRCHLDWRGMFPTCGRFAKRMNGFFSVRDGQWKTEEHWCYFAATQKAAAEDLRRWQDTINAWGGIDDARYQSWIDELKTAGKI